MVDPATEAETTFGKTLYNITPEEREALISRSLSYLMRFLCGVGVIIFVFSSIHFFRSATFARWTRDIQNRVKEWRLRKDTLRLNDAHNHAESKGLAADDGSSSGTQVEVCDIAAENGSGGLQFPGPPYSTAPTAQVALAVKKQKQQVKDWGGSCDDKDRKWYGHNEEFSPAQAAPFDGVDERSLDQDQGKLGLLDRWTGFEAKGNGNAQMAPSKKTWEDEEVLIELQELDQARVVCDRLSFSVI